MGYVPNLGVKVSILELSSIFHKNKIINGHWITGAVLKSLIKPQERCIR